MFFDFIILFFKDVGKSFTAAVDNVATELDDSGKNKYI